jgi:L-fucose mutarotase
MLKLIDPSLNGDVLHALRSMGHGDELVLSDTNFPADSVARHTVVRRLLHIDNVSAARAAKAILSLLPLDSFVDAPALRMEIVGNNARCSMRSIARKGGRGRWARSSARRSYERARQAYCVVRSGERRFYGCFIFTKGVVAPDVVV